MGVCLQIMSRECKQACRLKCLKDSTIKFTFNRSAGRSGTYITHKFCSVCEYWVSLNDERFSETKNCFCCGNKFRNRVKTTEGNKRRRNTDVMIRIEQIIIDYYKSLNEEISSGNENPPPLLLETYNK